MSRRRRLQRYEMSGSDRWRICLYLTAGGGWHYKTIAWFVFHDGKGHRGVVSPAETTRVARVAKEEDLGSRDWRNGKSESSNKMLSRLGRTKETAKKMPKLRLAV